jgi:hypothetical protein
MLDEELRPATLVRGGLACAVQNTGPPGEVDTTHVAGAALP